MDDFESFTSYLGFDGIDSDMFYEAYYELDANDEEYECVIEESYESAYWKVPLSVCGNRHATR